MLFAMVSKIGELAATHMGVPAALVVGTLNQWQHELWLRIMLWTLASIRWAGIGLFEEAMCRFLTFVAQSVQLLDFVRLAGQLISDDLRNRLACHGCDGHGFWCGGLVGEPFPLKALDR
jgi:hypothetical protein